MRLQGVQVEAMARVSLEIQLSQAVAEDGSWKEWSPEDRTPYIQQLLAHEYWRGRTREHLLGV